MKPTEKTCARCHRLLPASEFYPSKRTLSGLTSACKDCERAYKRAEYARNRKKPDGVFIDQRTGRRVIHRGCSRALDWSDSMLLKLRREFPTTKNEDLCIDFDVSRRTLIRKARELGLVKDPEWMRQQSSDHARMAVFHNKHCGNSGQFRKGEHASPATEFKPKNKTV